MLNRVKISIINILTSKYGFTLNMLRMYFHPSFWYLHLHVNLINKSYNGMSVDHCHTLNSVIQNLQIDTDYYKKIKMEVVK